MRTFAVWLIVLCGAAISRADHKPLAIEKYAPSSGYTIEEFGLVKYDTLLKSPRWVVHQITEESVTGEATREHLTFKVAGKLPPKLQTHPAWFANTGFDLGHCAPAADFKCCQTKMTATFTMLNVMCQRGNLNRHLWEQLEVSVRGLAQDEALVTIITGPAYLPDKNGRLVLKSIHGGIYVPTHCFKALLLEKETHKECKAWLVPNIDDPGPANSFDQYRLSTDALEDAIGEDLWNGVLTVEEQSTLERFR